MQLIDTHCHLDVAEFSEDLSAVIQRADTAGVSEMIVPAIDQAHWQHLSEITDAHPELHPAFGLHPMFMSAHRKEHLDQLERWLHEHRAVAVGECGLDFYIPEHDKTAQIEYFEAQLNIARNQQLPVIIHCRKAMDQVIHSLRKIRPLSGVLHSFSGSLQQAEQCMDLGFLFGIGGPITYERAMKFRALVAQLPEDSLLLETDAPDQPIHGFQGQRNEPARIIHVLRAIAEVRKETPETVATYTTENARRLFRLSGQPSD